MASEGIHGPGPPATGSWFVWGRTACLSGSSDPPGAWRGHWDLPWLALFVESPRRFTSNPETRARVEENLRLAETLGGQTAVIEGSGRVHEDILAFARSHNITRIVMGKPSRPKWIDLFTGSPVDDLIRQSGDIDVYVITGGKEEPVRSAGLGLRITSSPRTYLLSALAVGSRRSSQVWCSVGPSWLTS